ncbi:Lactaldehyde reductase [BD1-7 clade bacterium]|uniref:Lactaldehyde reductase n=1 Tax=BD1-7 clade bacterium TaxID=2029982 RepID=A0A5S9QGK1_9GAMM|nr:Lactaldehyde reductase [BD1-7 clade bacterium]CAA0117176.1 Lactaldehyde reductase [BD1-7 clade bacterium]
MSITEQQVSDIVNLTIDQTITLNGFSFRSPPLTLSGEGSTLRVGESLSALGVHKAFIVADAVVAELGLIDSTRRSLHRSGISYSIFDDIVAEPTAGLVQRCKDQLKTFGADAVIGIGGGSALDTAKAVALLIDSSASIADLAAGAQAERKVRLVAIPTTAGTGSEVTDITVIMEDDHSHKYVIKSAHLMPDLAILDAHLMIGVPPVVTAATGIDALTHAIEAYLSSQRNPISEAMAFASIQMIVRALPIAVGNGSNQKARSDMALAAYKAGLAFSNAGLGLVHAMSHQIGARYRIPHGVANAILLPKVMNFNALVCRSELANIARAMGVARDNMTEREQASAAIGATAELVKDVGLPDSLAKFDVKLEDLNVLADDALADICLVTNPRHASSADIVAIYQACLGTQ